MVFTASVKTVTNYGYFTGSRIPPPPPPPNETGGNSKRIVSLNSAFDNADSNHPPVMKSNTVTRFKIISGLRNSLQNHRRVPVCRGLKRVNGRIFTISIFKGASQNFIF